MCNCHSELCKVCGGTGKYHESNSGCGTTGAAIFERICHGCGGKGYVVIHCDCCCNKTTPIYPYNPIYPTNPWIGDPPNWTWTVSPATQCDNNI